MIPQDFNDLATLFNSPWFMLLIVWSMLWKGLALWHAGQRKQKVWFIILFIFNTLGLLEILYLLFVAKAIVEIKIVRDRQEK